MSQKCDTLVMAEDHDSQSTPALPALNRNHYRIAAIGLARSIAMGIGVVMLYWALPTETFDSPLYIALVIAGSLVLWMLLVMRELRKIVDAPHPVVRLAGAVIATIMLLVVTFAQVYLTLDHSSPGNFNETMNKMGALYFSMTVTATVGFGDIVAKTDLARGIVTFQMLINLVLLAAAVRSLITVASSYTRLSASSEATSARGSAGDEKPAHGSSERAG